MVTEFIVGAIIGGIGGYYIGQHKAYTSTDLSQRSSLLTSLNNQVSEMKAKFDAYDTLRDQKEKDSEKYSKQRELRYQEFMESTKSFFEKQEKVREGFEGKRDKQMESFSNIIAAFNRTIHGSVQKNTNGKHLQVMSVQEGGADHVVLNAELPPKG